jgi:hypothetical protein
MALTPDEIRQRVRTSLQEQRELVADLLRRREQLAGSLFVRFGEVFEGLLPVRRLGRERFEIDRLGVAQVGRTTGRRHRLGDSIAVRVQSIDRARGRVLLDRIDRPRG